MISGAPDARVALRLHNVAVVNDVPLMGAGGQESDVMIYGNEYQLRKTRLFIN